MTTHDIAADAALIEAYREKHPGLPRSGVVYKFGGGAGCACHPDPGPRMVTGHRVMPAHPDAIREYAFEGARPGLAYDQLVNDIVQASLVYATEARRRMGLHAAHRISITVPFDEARRGLFEDAEANLWSLGVVFDWSLYTTWRIGKELTAGFEPDDILTMTEDGWKVRPDKANPWPPALSRDDVLALAARLIYAQEIADDRNRRMTATTEAPAVAA